VGPRALEMSRDNRTLTSDMLRNDIVHAIATRSCHRLVEKYYQNFFIRVHIK